MLLNKILFSCLFFCFSLGLHSQDKTINIYVDPAKGNDFYNGTAVSSSFKTLNKAKEAVRKINKSNYKRIVVNLRGGYYELAETLQFNETNGGNSTCSIVYKNYRDETPIISGGTFITSWELYDQAKNIYRAKLDSFSIRQLYINGKRAIRARQPNAGLTNKIVAYKKQEKKILFNQKEVSQWKNINKVEIVTVNQFTTNHLRIENVSYDSQYADVSIQSPEAEILIRVSDPFSWNFYWFENAYEFIDVEGEWYQNTNDGYIYYKPYSFENMLNVVAVAPRLETIMNISGGALDKPVQYIEFQGIQFMYSTWLWPDNNGCVEFQAFHPFCTNQTIENERAKGNTNESNFSAPGGVYVAKAAFINFTRCGFMHMGANGLKLHFSTSYCNITGNVVDDISGNGIYEMMPNYDCVADMEKYNPNDKREVCHDDIISNNYISNCGADYEGAVGIFCGFTKNVTISHNEIFNIPYSGISVGWGWGEPSGVDLMSGNKIINNYIHDVNTDTIMYDGGAIYTLGDQPNSICKGNYCISRCRGLFFDEGTGHYTVTNNVVDAGLEWIAIWNKKQHDILANRNYSRTSKIDNNGTNCIIKNTTIVTDTNWPDTAQFIIKNAGVEVPWKKFKR